MKILILAANPKNTPQLRLDEEVREIEEGLIRAKQRDRFELVQRWAARPRDMQRAILELHPQIVHFSGHGTGEDGLVLENGQGQAQLVPTAALAGLFELFADQVQCVLLNACYSEVQGQAIAQHIPYVIGMKQAIGDIAAREFSVGFYDALGAGRDMEFAFKYARNSIQMTGLTQDLTPVFLRGKSSALPDTADPPLTQHQLTPQPNFTYPRFSFEVVTVDPWGQIIGRRKASASYQILDLGQGVTLEMVKVPGGTFMMGSPSDELERTEDEGPQHPVTLTDFWIGKYPVTHTQWWAAVALPRVDLNLDPNPSTYKGDNRPVEHVTWFEAMEFCARVSTHNGQPCTLPSEAQWEYACRAGTTKPFYFGETLTTDLANYASNYTYSSGPKGTYRQEATDVGSFSPNGFGLYDMHGNVWEWCLDHYHHNYEGAPSDGSAWVDPEAWEKEYRILRGGCWGRPPMESRCAYRLLSDPDDRNYSSGFRILSIPSRAL